MADHYEIVPFNNHKILTIRNSTSICVVMKPIVESMGIPWEPQRKRIQRHPVLSKGTSMMEVPSSGGMQEMLCLPLEHFHGWLITLNPENVNNQETRALIITYQERGFRVIFEHFHGPMGRSPTPKSITSTIAQQNQVLRITGRLQRTNNRDERRTMYEMLGGLCAELGIATPPLDGLGFDAPTPPDLLPPFWIAISDLRDAGKEFNHSRAAGVLALNLPEIKHLFKDARIKVSVDANLKAALRLSSAPRFIDAKALNSKIGRTVNCWIFDERQPDLLV